MKIDTSLEYLSVNLRNSPISITISLEVLIFVMATPIPQVPFLERVPIHGINRQIRSQQRLFGYCRIDSRNSLRKNFSFIFCWNCGFPSSSHFGSISAKKLCQCLFDYCRHGNQGLKKALAMDHSTDCLTLVQFFRVSSE